MSKSNSKAGLSLIEVVAAIVLLVIGLGLTVTGYMFSLNNTNQADVQDELDIDVQLALEHLKKDLRLSSLDEIFYYPEGPGPYQAISFPVAKDSDGDGLLEMDTDGTIIWDDTVIYHIRPTTPNQLVKTTFSPRADLSDAQRQTQLDTVVDTGYGTSAANGDNSSSSVLFANLLNWNITPEAGRFDAYAAEEARQQVSLGYCLLDTGSHSFNFEVIEKNSASSGYKIGIDQLSVSPSYSAREAETQTVSSQSGATATAEYREGGSWNGNYQLVFPATQTGNNFTLSMENDRWEETNFRGQGYECNDTTVVFDLDLSPKDYVVQLEGNDYTWEAELQTGSQPSDSPAGLMKNWCVRMLQKGSELADNGNWFAYNGRKCRLKFDASSNGKFDITNVFIGESASTTNASLDFNEATVKAVKFNGNTGSPVAQAGASIVSDWVDFEIDKDKNYLVSYRIVNNADKCHPAIWVDSRDSDAMTCMVVTNGSGATAKDKTWSDRPGIDPFSMKGVIGLSAIEATYPAEGTYVSPIFDTRLDAPQYQNLDWNAEVPSGTALSLKVRTGDLSDLSDTGDWSTLTAHTSPCAISAAYKRYVQFQATLTSSDDGLSTPQLKDVTVDWTGEKKLVNIGGLFTMGPEYGIFEITVDDQPLRSALIVNLEIYKDIFSTKDQMHRISSSLEVNLAPRNTGL